MMLFLAILAQCEKHLVPRMSYASRRSWDQSWEPWTTSWTTAWWDSSGAGTSQTVVSYPNSPSQGSEAVAHWQGADHQAGTAWTNAWHQADTAWRDHAWDQFREGQAEAPAAKPPKPEGAPSNRCGNLGQMRRNFMRSVGTKLTEDFKQSLQEGSIFNIHEWANEHCSPESYKKAREAEGKSVADLDRVPDEAPVATAGWAKRKGPKEKAMCLHRSVILECRRAIVEGFCASRMYNITMDWRRFYHTSLDTVLEQLKLKGGKEAHEDSDDEHERKHAVQALNLFNFQIYLHGPHLAGPFAPSFIKLAVTC